MSPRGWGGASEGRGRKGGSWGLGVRQEAAVYIY